MYDIRIHESAGEVSTNPCVSRRGVVGYFQRFVSCSRNFHQFSPFSLFYRLFLRLTMNRNLLCLRHFHVALNVIAKISKQIRTRSHHTFWNVKRCPLDPRAYFFKKVSPYNAWLLFTFYIMSCCEIMSWVKTRPLVFMWKIQPNSNFPFWNSQTFAKSCPPFSVRWSMRWERPRAQRGNVSYKKPAELNFPFWKSPFLNRPPIFL